MLGEWFSNLLQGIADVLSWLSDKISSFFVYLWHTVWNYVVGLFWDLYSVVVQWIADTIAAVLPSDTLDFDQQTNVIISNIVGFDQLLPIHECFGVLSFLIAYHLVKLAVKYGTFAVTMVRKFLPF